MKEMERKGEKKYECIHFSSSRHYRCKEHKNWWTIEVVNVYKFHLGKISKHSVQSYEAFPPLCIVLCSSMTRCTKSGSKERIKCCILSLQPAKTEKGGKIYWRTILQCGDFKYQFLILSTILLWTDPTQKPPPLEYFSRYKTFISNALHRIIHFQ